MDRTSLRQKALERGQIIDRESIGERVYCGDIVFSRRVLLNALIECNDDIKRHILEQVTREHFPENHFRVIFETVLQSIETSGKIDEDELYRRMENRVRDHWPSAPEINAKSGLSAEDVLPGYLAVIDHILAIETPDQELIEKALGNARRFEEWRKRQGFTD